MKKIREHIHPLFYMWILALIGLLIPLCELYIVPILAFLSGLVGVSFAVLIALFEKRLYKQTRSEKYKITRWPVSLFFVFTLTIALIPEEYKGYGVLSTGFYVATLALILTILSLTGKWKIGWENIK